jgi:hypothetical protein
MRARDPTTCPPAEFVNSAGQLAGNRGVTFHREVSLAWKKSTHTDPGPNFPTVKFLDAVKAQL